MTRLIATSKKNPCPVCDKTNGNCRTGEDNKVLCMTFPDGDGNSGYRFIKPAKEGLWGIHYPRTENDFDREAWLQRKAERESRELEIERQRLEKCLTPEQRHKEYQRLFTELTLSGDHRQNLLDRGLSEPDIQRLGYKSIERYHRLNGHYHVNLPGMGKFGNSLANYEQGLLVPVKDADGYIVGYQYRTSECYKWSRGAKTLLGEQPMGLAMPPSGLIGDRVGTGEGFLKTQIAASRLGIPFVGASGGHFTPKETARLITSLGNDLEFVDYPDAGWLVDDNVKRRTLSRLELLHKLGCDVLVADWGQGQDKNVGDIDEIDLSSIEIVYRPITDYIKVKKSLLQKVKDSGNAFLRKLIGKPEDIVFNKKRESTGLLPTKVHHYSSSQEMTKLYEKLAREGKKFILDISPTGCGKTWTVSQLNRSAMFLVPDTEYEVLSRLFYVPPSYRNPTNAKIEEDWYETPARNNGYYINYAKQTELGNPYRESLKGLGEIDDHERTQSNCHKAEEFHKFYAAGREPEGICKGCELRDKCAVKKGDGYGYISEVKHWIAKSLIRTSAQWLDKDKVLTCDTGLIFDEAGRIPWQINTSVTREYLHSLMDKIRRESKDLHRMLLPVQYALVDVMDECGNYGEGSNKIVNDLQISDDLIKQLEVILQIELGLEERNEGDEIPPVFLFDLIRIAAKLTKGSIHLSTKNLTIQVPNHRLIQACHAAKFLICQDATWSASEMAMVLGINPDDITVICQGHKTPENIVIEHWKDIGNLGNQRCEGTQKMVEQIKAKLAELYPGLGLIDWKAHSDGGTLIHCGDSRGSNAYQYKEVVASIGLPRPNMTAVQLQYETMAGRFIESFDDKEFKAFYNHQVAANVIQEIGRLRANRRPDERLKFILIGDGDLNFLSDMGFDLVEKDAATALEFDVGKKGARARYMNLGSKICRALGKDWLEMSMRDLAKELDRAASTVSRWIKRYFGQDQDESAVAFERFKQLVYAAVYGESTDDSKFTEDEVIVIGAVTEMLKGVEKCGNSLGKEFEWLLSMMSWDVFLESVKRLPDDYGIKLIASIYRVALTS